MSCTSDRAAHNPSAVLLRALLQAANPYAFPRLLMQTELLEYTTREGARLEARHREAEAKLSSEVGVPSSPQLLAKLFPPGYESSVCPGISAHFVALPTSFSSDYPIVQAAS